MPAFLFQAADGGVVSVWTVALAFIGFLSVLGPGVLLWMNAKLAADIKARDEAREEAREKREEAAKEEKKIALALASERNAKQTESLAEIHTLTNSQLSKIQEALTASREETRVVREKVETLLQEKADAATGPALAAAPVAVYTAPGDAVAVSGDEAAPLPVDTVRKGSKPNGG